MDIYQQTVTAEQRAAQELAFDTLMGANTDFSGLSSDRTLPNPRRVEKEEVNPVIS